MAGISQRVRSRRWADLNSATARRESFTPSPTVSSPLVTLDFRGSRLAPVHHNPHLGRGAVVGALTARFRNDRRELFTNARNKLAITT